MAVNGKAGRPVSEADIDWGHSPGQELYNRFYEACRTLNYGDMCNLAKAFKVSLAAVMLWKSGKRFPVNKDIPFFIIGWVEAGKPVRTRTQAEIASNMLVAPKELRS